MSACEETFVRREIQANLYLDSLISRKTKLQHTERPDEMGISTIQSPEQNVPPGDSSIEVGQNTAPAVCEYINSGILNAYDSDDHTSVNNDQINPYSLASSNVIIITVVIIMAN